MCVFPQLPFHTGRSDASGSEEPTPNSVHSPDGRLPDADGACVPPGVHVEPLLDLVGWTLMYQIILATALYVFRSILLLTCWPS